MTLDDAGLRELHANLKSYLREVSDDDEKVHAISLMIEGTEDLFKAEFGKPIWKS